MGRKTKITKGMILQAAFELLEESGIGAVAIKQIASRLGCSTQPVSWQFGSMTELKKELYVYAAGKMYSCLEEKMRGKDAIEAFFISGVHYLSVACDHPYAFRFLNVDDPMETIGEPLYGDNSIFSFQFDKEALKILTEQYDISPDLLSEMVRDTVIYTHGLAMMMLFDGHRLPKKEACRMMFNMGMKLAEGVGIPADRDFEALFSE
ncbi:MAG: TetR/AcrR family transcriptional regulator [Lachnospiraceae bacterium]|nr:TetR/AcrR family transcriptional regulator [Lachnospiraceae bacterium]